MNQRSDEEYMPDEEYKEDDFTNFSNETKKQKKIEKIDLSIRPKKQRGHGTEAKRVSARLNGFDSENSHAWSVLKEMFSSGITHSELKSLASLICMKTDLKLDRDAVRDNRVLIKWFEENWVKIHPILHNFHIHDSKGEIISSVREREIENFS